VKQNREDFKVGPMAWGSGPSDQYIFGSLETGSDENRAQYSNLHMQFNLITQKADCFGALGDGDAMALSSDGNILRVFNHRWILMHLIRRHAGFSHSLRC
jgi:hypothetical protein